ncbi:MAG: ABC transporter ATP-binding protein/permease [Rhodospirillaceae bacterium]|nr:ABC transporter ATP-binding protein/permease [Rhodospirillaceae bacterium]
MGNHTAETSTTVASERVPSFFRRFLGLAMPFWSSEDGWRLTGLGLALLILTVTQVAFPIALNVWNEKLFNALEEREMQRFEALIGVLFLIIVGNVLVTSTHLRVKRRLQVAWRQWLTYRVFRDWMSGGRQYLLNYVPGDHDNPDGRIAEDIRITTEAAIDLAHSLFYSILLLISFTQILWTLSGPVLTTFGGLEVPLPGHLVWLAIVYSVLGTVVAWALGRPLVRAVDRRQTDEANFRFGLVHARENAMAIALLHGETGERRHFRSLFRRVVQAWDGQTWALTKLMYFTSSWSVLSMAFPFLVAAPRYITGMISLGILMQTAQAFGQMTAALSWPIDNLAGVAEWRASVERVLRLVDGINLISRRIVAGGHDGIHVTQSETSELTFRDVEIADSTGATQIARFSTLIAAGERVLVTGDPGAAVKLFKVAARLWPWGHGRVGLPSGASIFFMPRRPYLPIGPLRTAIVFPEVPSVEHDDALRAALVRVGLNDFAKRLDDVENWEQNLAVGEQQRLGFARLLMHRPDWIFIEEATNGLDREMERQMMELTVAEYPKAAIITISHRTSVQAFHQRRLTLVRVNGFAVVEDCLLP